MSCRRKGQEVRGEREAEIVGMLKGVLAEFSGELEGRKIFLFGSRVTGKSRERSDFDIGVIGAEPLPLKIYYKMEDRFDDLPTLYRIDWVDFNRVSEKFRERAMKQVEVLYG